jgi:hypothetical protein
MITKTNVMFFLGAWMTAIAVRLFAYPFVGPHLADRLALEAGLLFAVFAFAGTVKRSLLIAALTLLWGAGLFYFVDYRRDSIGFAVMVACGIVAYLIIQPLKLQPSR